MNKNIAKHFKKNKSIIVIFVIMAILYFVLYWLQGAVYNNIDYRFHNPTAKWLIEEGIVIGYPGYQLIVGAVAMLLGGINAVNLAAAFVCTACALASAYVTYLLLTECIGIIPFSKNVIRAKYRLFLMILAFLINVVQPIFLPSIKPGFSSGNGYVSPTQLLCKPFALLSVLLFLKQKKFGVWNLRRQILLIIILCLSCMAKPVFAMVFVPAMGILLFFEELFFTSNNKCSLLKTIGNTLRKGWPLIVSGVFFDYSIYLLLSIKAAK